MSCKGLARACRNRVALLVKLVGHSENWEDGFDGLSGLLQQGSEARSESTLVGTERGACKHGIPVLEPSSPFTETEGVKPEAMNRSL